MRLDISNVRRKVGAWAGLLALVALAVLAMQRNVVALSEEELYFYAQNNIAFYDPGSCTGSSGTATYDNLVIGRTMNEQLEWVVEQYGELAMDLQREWGTPWEVVFAQMVVESQVGTATDGIAAAVARNGYYNWLGITGSGGEQAEGVEPYVSSTGRKWAQFPGIENMIRAWAGKYIARNGYYNKAFSHLDPVAYDLRGFLNDFIMVYAPPVENDTSRYITNVMSLINGSIKTVREAKGWPSSEELATNENIPIGGQNPIGGSSSGGSASSSSICTKLRSSPDYNSTSYQDKLANLHEFSQISGMFADYNMCLSATTKTNSTIKNGGCGVMSLSAAYYMFSGVGLKDAAVFEELSKAAQADGYNICNMSNTASFGSNLTAYTQITKEDLSDLSWNNFVTKLQQGKKIIISSATEYFTRSSGHIMLLDHYNAEKDMIFMFDSAMGSDRTAKLDAKIAEKGSSYIEYYNGNAYNGLYMSRAAMEELVQARSGRALTYDGCYNGGTTGVNVCRVTSVGLVSGGMDYEQAVEFMAAYRAEAAKKLNGDYGSGYANGTVIGEGYIGDAGCWGGTLNNCVAFSRWFVNNYTTAGPKSKASGDGWAYAGSLISQDGFSNNGSVPVAYAVFSKTGGEWGHTGVVLGVNQSKNEIYIGEAGCTAGYRTAGDGYSEDWPGVHVKNLDLYTNSGYVYAYPGEKLKLGDM